MNWLIWSVTAAFALTCYNALFRLASAANIFAFLMIANGVAFAGYFVIGHFFHKQNDLGFDNKIILCGILTGLVIVGIELSILAMLKNGASGVTLGYPVLNIVTLILTFAVGILFFKEKIIWQNALGIAFGLLSVWLLAYKKA